MRLAAERSRIDWRLFEFEAEMKLAMAGGGIWTVIADAYEPRPFSTRSFDLVESIRRRADEQRERIRGRFARFGGDPTWPGPVTSPVARKRESKREKIIAFLLSGATSIRAALRDRRHVAPTPVRRAARTPRRNVARAASAKETCAAGTSDGEPEPGASRPRRRVGASSLASGAS